MLILGKGLLTSEDVGNGNLRFFSANVADEVELFLLWGFIFDIKSFFV